MHLPQYPRNLNPAMYGVEKWWECHHEDLQEANYQITGYSVFGSNEEKYKFQYNDNMAGTNSICVMKLQVV